VLTGERKIILQDGTSVIFFSNNGKNVETKWTSPDGTTKSVPRDQAVKAIQQYVNKLDMQEIEQRQKEVKAMISKGVVLDDKNSMFAGGLYVGGLKSGKPDGVGKVIGYMDDPPVGPIYEGEWKNGKMNGKGRLVDLDNSVCEGQWNDDKPHGYMKCECEYKWQGIIPSIGSSVDPRPGSSIEGTWKNGAFLSGVERYRAADGSTVELKVQNRLLNDRTIVQQNGKKVTVLWDLQ